MASPPDSHTLQTGLIYLFFFLNLHAGAHIYTSSSKMRVQISCGVLSFSEQTPFPLISEITPHLTRPVSHLLRRNSLTSAPKHGARAAILPLFMSV